MFADGLYQILTSNFDNIDIYSFRSIKNLKKEIVDFSEIDLFISDIELPEENIFELFEEMKLSQPKIPILVISMHNKLSVIKKCMNLNIEGFILKDDSINIKQVVDNMLAGENYYSPKVMATYKILSIESKELTPREEQILALLSNGKLSYEISDELHISEHTLKTHIKNIKRKLGLSKTNELIIYYFNNYVK